MKQILIIVTYLMSSLSVAGQSKINNILTTEYQNVVGTKISLIPPQGFLKASNFLGFQQNQNGSTIMVLDIPGPFSEVSKGFTKEKMLSQGVEVKEIENLIVNNLPAVFLTGEQNAYGNIYTKYVLAFGTDKETIIINGASPNNLKEIGKAVKLSILSSFYEADKKINPFEVVDFEINVSASKLIFAKSMVNSLIFTPDGILPTKSINKTLLTVGKSFSKTSIEDRKLFSLNRLKQFPIEILKIESTEEINIDRISGYEIIAITNDKKTNEQEKVYLALLFSDNLYYIFYGSTNQNFDVNIEGLKKSVKTFRRK